MADNSDLAAGARGRSGERTAPQRFELARLAFRAVRSLPERLLHSRRRAEARRLVSSDPPIRSILVICHGNLCRSPFAAALLARNAPTGELRRTVTSAGLVGPGRQAPEHALTASLAHNVDLRGHRSRLLTHADVKAAELIVVMSAEQAALIQRRFWPVAAAIVVLGDLDPMPISARTIRDPWRQDLSVFEESYTRIERCIAELERLLVKDAVTD